MTTLHENIAHIRDKIAEAAVKSGRSEKDVLLVAVSKMRSAEEVLSASPHVDIFGENRVQEMLEKKERGAYSEAPLHFIGHLQRNKVNKVVGAVSLIQSVSSRTLMLDIANRSQALQITSDILIEVNIGNEASKSGVSPGEADELIAEASGLHGIYVRGLMTIPPIHTESVPSTKYFRNMYKLFVDISTKKYNNSSMEFLSMGMSGDFQEAILEGSNMVRVGTALFGLRTSG